MADDLDVDDSFSKPVKPAAKKGAPKKKGGGMPFIIVAVVVVLLGGGGAAWYLGALDSLLGKAKPAEGVKAVAVVEPAKPAVYHPLPPLLVDLKSGECRGTFLKLQLLAAVSGEKEIARLKAVEPVMMDQMTAHLRGLERKDLAGREGAETLRTNLAAIIERAAAPEKVRGVLFKEFLLQ